MFNKESYKRNERFAQAKNLSFVQSSLTNRLEMPQVDVDSKPKTIFRIIICVKM